MTGSVCAATPDVLPAGYSGKFSCLLRAGHSGAHLDRTDDGDTFAWGEPHDEEIRFCGCQAANPDIRGRRPVCTRVVGHAGDHRGQGVSWFNETKEQPMQANRREITTTRVVYTLPSGAHWSEVQKVFGAIHGQYGDTVDVTVEAHDEELWISYVKPAVAV